MSTSVDASTTARPQYLRLYLFAYAANTLGAGLVYPLTALFLLEGLDAPLSVISLYFLVIAGTAMVVNPIAGRSVDRFGPVPVTTTAITLQFLGAATLSLTPGYQLALLGAALAGAGNGAFFASQTPLLVSLFGRPALSRVFGTQYSIMNGMLALAAISAGLLVEAFKTVGFRAAFGGNAASFVVYGFIVFGFIAPRTRASRGDELPPRAPRALYPPTRTVNFDRSSSPSSS